MPDGFGGAYIRMSMDRTGAGLGVDRQLADCRPLILRRGYREDQIRVYVDNDISAYQRRKPRDGYQRLLDDIRSGDLTFLTAWHSDRLHRRSSELEEFIEIVAAAPVELEIEMARAGVLDLSTPTGRAVAKTLAAWGQFESEHKGDRLRRKHLELAMAGKNAGGGRPFGYEPDRLTVRPEEAELVREAVRRVLAGESLRAVCLDWSTRAIPTVRGVRPNWHPKVLRQILVSARISGRREMSMVDGHRRGIGKVTAATAAWPAIIGAEDSDRLRAMFGSGERMGPPRRQLLSGIARCSFCGRPLRGRTAPGMKPMLACPQPPDGCNRIRILSEPAEKIIRAAVKAVLDGGALEELRRRAAGDADQVAVEELAQVRAKLAELATHWAEDRISREEWHAAKATLDARERRLQRRVDSSRRVRILADLPGPLPEGWLRAPLPQQRALLSLLVESIVVHPGQRGAFDPGRLEVRWRA